MAVKFKTSALNSYVVCKDLRVDYFSESFHSQNNWHGCLSQTRICKLEPQKNDFLEEILDRCIITMIVLLKSINFLTLSFCTSRKNRSLMLYFHKKFWKNPIIFLSNFIIIIYLLLKENKVLQQGIDTRYEHTKETLNQDKISDYS